MTIAKKINGGLFLAVLMGILGHNWCLKAIHYTYYPAYGIVTGTGCGILNITQPVAKLLPAEVGGKTVLGYVDQMGQNFALVLDGERSEMMHVEVENMARGLMRGEGVSVYAPSFDVTTMP